MYARHYYAAFPILVLGKTHCDNVHILISVAAALKPEGVQT